LDRCIEERLNTSNNVSHQDVNWGPLLSELTSPSLPTSVSATTSTIFLSNRKYEELEKFAISRNNLWNDRLNDTIKKFEDQCKRGDLGHWASKGQLEALAVLIELVIFLLTSERVIDAKQFFDFVSETKQSRANYRLALERS
jgi:hypothetical protein